MNLFHEEKIGKNLIYVIKTITHRPYGAVVVQYYFNMYYSVVNCVLYSILKLTNTRISTLQNAKLYCTTKFIHSRPLGTYIHSKLFIYYYIVHTITETL